VSTTGQPAQATGRRSVTVVTGVAGLIGGRIAEVLTERGVDVVGVDVVAPPRSAPAAWIEVQADLTDERAVRGVATSVRAEHGGIDAVVHAAALTGRSPDLGTHTLRSVDLDLWRRVIEVNLTGALLCIREFGALLRPEPLGQILVVGSVQGLVPTMGASAYAVSKAALTGLVRQFAAEFAPEGIGVNLVAPGPVADAGEVQRLREQGLHEAPTPMGAYLSPRDMAEAICDLLTGSFGFMTGAVIPIDGGEHLRPRTGPSRAHDGASHDGASHDGASHDGASHDDA